MGYPALDWTDGIFATFSAIPFAFTHIHTLAGLEDVGKDGGEWRRRRSSAASRFAHIRTHLVLLSIRNVYTKSLVEELSIT
jgi:hypothetical protein